MIQDIIQSGAFLFILPIIAIIGLLFCEWEEHKLRVIYKQVKDSIDDAFANIKRMPIVKPSTDNVKKQVSAMLNDMGFKYREIVVETESQSAYSVKVY